MLYLIVGLAIAGGIGWLLWWGLRGPRTELADWDGQDMAIWGTDAQRLVRDALDDLGREQGRATQAPDSRTGDDNQD